MPLTSDFDKYLIFINEPIDKLTVNRSFERIYQDISKIDSKNIPLTVSKATSSNYGLVKFSSASGYMFAEPSSEDITSCDNYFNNVLGIEQLRKFVDNTEKNSDIDSFFSSSSKPAEEISAWIDFKTGGISFVSMPNGNIMMIGNFDIAMSNIPIMFKTDSVLSGDIEYPVIIDGFKAVIDADEDLLTLEDYARDIDGIIGGDSGLMGLSSFIGKQIESDYISPLSATLKHSKCNWTSYSSYKQSYVEIIYSMSIDISSLSKKYFDYSMYNVYNGGEKTTESITGDIGVGRKPFVFTHKPIIIPQVSFYNNESRIKPFAKYCSIDKKRGIEEDYYDDVYFSESPLTEQEYLENNISTVNGGIVMKKYENIYSKNGTISNNKVTFDISLKFFVGGAADPHLIDGMTTINSKAKVQLLMIGI